MSVNRWSRSTVFAWRACANLQPNQSISVPGRRVLLRIGLGAPYTSTIRIPLNNTSRRWIGYLHTT